ncbi:hypothetical protein TL16_g13360, partial [Triparma laevis f. inornata]
EEEEAGEEDKEEEGVKGKEHSGEEDHKSSAAAPSPTNVPHANEREEEGVDNWDHKLVLTMRRLEVLPHAHLEDQKTTLSVSVSADDKNLWSTKSAKPKPTDGGGVFYSYKKQVYGLETSDALHHLNVSVAGGGKVIFAGGLLKLLDD